MVFIYRTVINLSNKKKKYIYKDSRGKIITNKKTIEYANSLGIAPAYKNVKINLNKNVELVATGIDAMGRTQYTYSKKHKIRVRREKYCNLINFGKKLPEINRKVSRHLKEKSFSKNKIISIILKIIMLCTFRIGTENCRKNYNSYGITTISKKQVKINGNKAIIDFIGKKGVQNTCEIKDKNMVKILRHLNNRVSSKEKIFSIDGENKRIDITNQDVNNFLKEFGTFSSKDFRTWYANIHLLNEILGKPISEKITERKKFINESVKIVAEKLHHTTAICKRDYILSEMRLMYIEDPNKFKKFVSKNSSENTFIKFLKWFC